MIMSYIWEYYACGPLAIKPDPYGKHDFSDVTHLGDNALLEFKPVYNDL